MLNLYYVLGIIFAIIPMRIAQNGNSNPTVTVDCGPMEGIYVSTQRGDCSMYLGIPFAEPPVGQLRWKKPQPPACWSGVKVAKQYGPRCIQLGSNVSKTESEDCLYLNIAVPRTQTNITNSTLLPVMVFIHGGWLYYGAASEYPLEGMCENLATRGVVIVSIQYRLNLYGMFSTGDSVAPGNYGLWDQIEALRWIKRNIANFGGDPNKITIFGESAGAKSVSYLTYTPVAKDLFHQTITESGSALAVRMALNDRSVLIGKDLAKAANCFGDSSISTNCLRQLSSVELQKIYNIMSPNTKSTNILRPLEWTFRKDGELYTEDKFHELGTMKPAIIGTNTMEIPIPEVNCMPEAHRLWENVLGDIFPGNDIKSDIYKYLAKFVYIDSKGDYNNATFVCQQLAKLQADLGYHAAAALEAQSKSASGSPVWIYNFDFVHKDYFLTDFPYEQGAVHTQELCYLFLYHPGPPTLPAYMRCPEKYEGDYRRVADYMGEMWTNFAKHGNPSPSFLVWPQFKSLTAMNTMYIRSNLTISNTFYTEIASFWNDLLPNIENDFNRKPRAANEAIRKQSVGVFVFVLLIFVISKE